MKDFFKFVMVYVLVFVSSAFVLLLPGCGHSVARIDRGTGVVLRIPLPNGDSLVEFKGGDIDSTTLILRGGSQAKTGRSVGGAFAGTGGSAKDLQISTIPQLNEGYMKDVMVSPDVPAEVKVELAKDMTIAKPDEHRPYRATVVGASVGSGENLDDVKPKMAGIDNIVDKVAEVTPEITEDVSKMVDSTTEAASSSVRDVMTASKTWIISISAAVVMIISIGVLIFILIRKKKIKKKIEEDVEQIVSQQP
jgi:hypothetical protein